MLERRLAPLVLVSFVSLATAHAAASLPPPAPADLIQLLASGAAEPWVAELAGCSDAEALLAWLFPGREEFALASFASDPQALQALRGGRTALAGEREGLRPNPLFSFSFFAPSLLGSPGLGPYGPACGGTAWGAAGGWGWSGLAPARSARDRFRLADCPRRAGHPGPRAAAPPPAPRGPRPAAGAAGERLVARERLAERNPRQR